MSFGGQQMMLLGVVSILCLFVGQLSWLCVVVIIDFSCVQGSQCVCGGVLCSGGMLIFGFVDDVVLMVCGIDILVVVFSQVGYGQLELVEVLVLFEFVFCIEVDLCLNVVIVCDLFEWMECYVLLIKLLDVELQLLEIEVIIIDINIDCLCEFGINWCYNYGLFSLMFGNGMVSDNCFNGQVDFMFSVNGGVIFVVIGD